MYCMKQFWIIKQYPGTLTLIHSEEMLGKHRRPLPSTYNLESVDKVCWEKDLILTYRVSLSLSSFSIVFFRLCLTS